MRKFALTLVVASLLVAGVAHACGSSIHTLQVNSPASVNTLVTPCDAIVTAVRANGFYASQAPHGAWDAIWVSYPGHTFVPGDLISICGLFKEVCGLTTIDIPGAGVYGYILKTGTAPVPPVNYVTAAAYLASPEQWESVTVTIVDGMLVPAGFSLGSGQWTVNVLGGSSLTFDDFWYNFAQVMEGQCYNNATGILHDSCGTYLFEPFANGITLVNCAVPAESMTLGTIKALFR